MSSHRFRCTLSSVPLVNLTSVPSLPEGLKICARSAQYGRITNFAFHRQSENLPSCSSIAWISCSNNKLVSDNWFMSMIPVTCQSTKTGSGPQALPQASILTSSSSLKPSALLSTQEGPRFAAAGEVFFSFTEIVVFRVLVRLLDSNRISR
jgi:hypothetical protein